MKDNYNAVGGVSKSKIHIYRNYLTKYFIKRLLEKREDKEEFSIEIKKYLLEHNIEIFASIRKKQLQNNSSNIYFPKELSD